MVATSCSIPCIPSAMLSSCGSKRALLRSSRFSPARTFTTSFNLSKPNVTTPTSSPVLRSDLASSFGTDDSAFVPVETVVDLQGKGLRKGSSEYRSHIRVSEDDGISVLLLTASHFRPNLRNMTSYTLVRSLSLPSSGTDNRKIPKTR